MTDAPAAPPGWYPQPDGTQRWWDGYQWGPVAPPSIAPPPAYPAPAAETLVVPAAVAPDKAWLHNRAYLGGLPDEPTVQEGNLMATVEGIGVGAFSPKHGVVKWTDASEIALTVAGQVAVRRRDGAVAYYEGPHDGTAREKIEPIAATAGVPWSATLYPAAPPAPKPAPTPPRQPATATPTAPTTAPATRKAARPRDVSFSHCEYLGGLPHDTSKHSGNLYVTADHIGIGVISAKKGLVKWQDVEGVSYTGQQVAKSRLGPELAFGVLGIGAKGQKDRADISVLLKDGTAAYYQVENKSGQAVKAKLAPILNYAGVPCVDDRRPTNTATTAAPDYTDQLHKLAGLRDAGVISSAEFEAKKAEILRRM